MTRYLMSLEDAIDLVLFAFINGNQGDIFIQKAPAATIETLAKAMLELFNSPNEIKIIGTRHGEKLYETLVSKEEMVKAVEMDNYYKISPDTRDLNYNLFFTNGDSKISEADEYNSHNTKQLTVEETKKLLLKLTLIQKELIADS
jgi:UDP-glucose 4-epimerase